MIEDEIRALAVSPDILTLGMLADEVRRRVRAAEVTYLRVFNVAVDADPADIPAAAREVRITGRPSSLAAAVAAVESVKNMAAGRHVSGFSLADLGTLAGAASLETTLRALRAAGLDMVAEAPVDRLENPESAFAAMESAGFTRARLTVDRAPGDDPSTSRGAGRLDLLLRAQSLAARSPIIVAISPLPMVLNAFRPTTGYEDVKLVALARLALPSIQAVQVDWLRYGPKLAQVALTFGADDFDNVPSVDDEPDGPRRSVLADVRRNIEAAGFVPVEREGDFTRR
jgi:aminodeoxyfutalosine synthase